MNAPRPTPYQLAMAPWADERFSPVRQALEGLDVDVWDRDAFLMAKPVVELVRALRPEEGLGEGMDEFVALLHVAYLYWMHGEPLRVVNEEGLRSLLGEPTPPLRFSASPTVRYVQVPPHRIWGAAVEGTVPEPLDGCFVVRRGDQLDVVGVFGVHPRRDGFTVVAVRGPRAVDLTRPDASAVFAPVLTGGKAAGLHSVTGMEELLELAWRTEAVT